MRLFDASTFTKIMGISVLTLALATSTVLFYLLPLFSDALMQGRVSKSENLVDVAVGVVDYHHDAVRQGTLDESEAKRLAMAQLRTLYYGQQDYFWINDLNGTILMHPLLPDLEGDNLLDERDVRGKPYMREMIEAARSLGYGYVQYVWPRPETLEPAPKISYVQLYEPWGWVIGGGLYVDDVQQEISALRTRVVGLSLAAMLALMTVAYVLAGVITDPIRQATEVAVRLAQGELPDVPRSERRDEPGRLLTAMGAMADTLRSRAAKAETISRGDLTVKVEPLSEQDVFGQALARMTTALRNQIGDIADSVNVLAVSVTEIAALVNQLATNSIQTSVSVDETVATVEELRQTSSIAASRAGDVSASARRNAEIAVTGQSATREAVLGMEDIRAKMDSISQSARELIENTRTAQEIIDTVNELADQSNLLAVNAAIEAAKVEQGAEGFSVVAAEMRSLAEESKRDALRVRKLLAQMRSSAEGTSLAVESGLASVGHGVERTSAAGEAIRSLAENISESAQSAVQIATIGRQQLDGVSQVLDAVQGIREANTQNSQAADSLRKEAARLEALGQRLKDMVGRYVVRKA